MRYFTRIGLSDYRPPNGNKEVYGFSASYATRQNGASALKIAIVWGIVCCYSLEIYLISLKLKFSVRLGYPRRPRAGIQDSGSIISGTWAKSSEYLYLHLLESALPVLVNTFVPHATEMKCMHDHSTPRTISRTTFSLRRLSSRLGSWKFRCPAPGLFGVPPM